MRPNRYVTRQLEAPDGTVHVTLVPVYGPPDHATILRALEDGSELAAEEFGTVRAWLRKPRIRRRKKRWMKRKGST
jgi:hypothetical protein